MEPLNILIVEDDVITANDIRETLEKAGHHITAIARTYQEAISALKRQPSNLAILDIRLEGSAADGIITAKELLTIHRMPIIYLTASSETETFQRAKETLPAAYLLKPFRHAELALQVELAYHHYRVNQKPSISPDTESLFLPINKGYESISKADVIFLQAEGAYVNIFLREKETPLLLSMNLGYLSQYFDAPNFYRLSRSLLINLKYVERLEGSSLFMRNHKLPLQIPENSRAELMKKLAVVRTR
jgi:DNA-binding LytR/AlgR family response regulator